MFWNKKNNKDSKEHKSPESLIPEDSQLRYHVTATFLEVRTLRYEIAKFKLELLEMISELGTLVGKEETKKYTIAYADKTLKWVVLDVMDKHKAKIIDVGFDNKEEAEASGLAWSKGVKNE